LANAVGTNAYVPEHEKKMALIKTAYKPGGKFHRQTDAE
jgi:hypothetical protein